jgi:hypothetical protein
VICGVTQAEPPDYMDSFRRDDWRRARSLQAELLKAAGWPNCRQTYRDNLAEALQWQRYCAELVKYPDRGHSGTGCDPASRAQALQKAEACVI